MAEREVRLRLQLADMPKTRGDCLTAEDLARDDAWLKAHPGQTPVDGHNAARPCPHARCRYHLTGAKSCALDVADDGAHGSRKIADAMGISRQRVEFIERRAMARARKRGLQRVGD